MWAKGDLENYIKTLVQEIVPEVRMNLASKQTPFACIVTCSDSRVSPELIFDEGIGSLFIIRIAGNVVDADALGSIEFSVGVLGTSLLLVMGHQGCGAVKAGKHLFLFLIFKAVEAAKTGKIPKNHVGNIVRSILPAVKKTLDEYPNLDGNDLVDVSIEANVRYVKDLIVANSSVVTEKLGDGSLTIKTAKYMLDSGIVKEIL